MGESNPEAIALIKLHTGHVPKHGMMSDGRQCVQIGDHILIATSCRLWSDPSVTVFKDEIQITWGGTGLSLPSNPAQTEDWLPDQWECR